MIRLPILLVAVVIGMGAAAGNAGTAIVTWQQQGRERLPPAEPDVHWSGGSGGTVAIAPDGSQILTGADSPSSVLLDRETGAVVQSWDEGWVKAVAFSPDGRRILIGVGKSALLRDSQTGEIVRSWSRSSPVSAVAFSPDGSRILAGSDDGTVAQWDVRTGATVQSWKHDGWVRAAAFSPDGRRALIACNGATVLRDARTGTVVRAWRHPGYPTAIAVSPDGRRVLVALNEAALLHEVQTGAVLHRWPLGGSSYAVAFSPEGQRVLIASGKAVLLQETRIGANLGTWWHTGHVCAVAFSRDGKRLLAAAKDGSAIVRHVGGARALFAARFLERGAALLSRLRQLPGSLATRRSELAGSRPSPPPTLAKGEFENSAAFQERIEKTRLEYERAVAAYNARVATLERDVNAFVASAPSRLTADRLAGAAAEALTAAFGDPALESIRYDADTQTFFADLAPAEACDLGLPRAVVVSDRIPNDLAPAFKSGLAGARPRVTFKVSEDGKLSFLGTSVDVLGRPYGLRPTEAEFRPAVVTAEVPVAAAPVALAGMTGLGPVSVAPLQIGLPSNPELARLEKEVYDLERRKAQEAAEKARREALERKKREIEAELSRGGEGGPDDLVARIEAAPAVPTDPHRYLFAAGVRDYAELPAVPFADRAAERFAQLARRRLGVPEENLVLLQNGRATGTALKGRLGTLLNRLTEADTLYFYFAGHGAPSRYGADSYLIPHDGVEGAYEDLELRLGALCERLGKSPAAKVVAVLDACFSGRIGPHHQLFKGVAPLKVVSLGGVDAGRMTVLAAGGGNQFANEYRERSNRLFSYHVISGLLDGKDRVADLFGYVRQQVDTLSRRKGLEYTQTPELLGGGEARLP